MRTGRPATPTDPCRSVLVLLVRLQLLLVLRADDVHVELADLADDVLQGGLRQGAGLAEDGDAVAVDDERGDLGDAVHLRQLGLGLGVDLGEDDVLVALGHALEDRSELTAGTAPGGPEVDEDDAVLHRLVVIGAGHGPGGH